MAADKRSRVRWWIAVAFIAVVVVMIQFVPVDRRNPPVTAPIRPPAAVAEILERSCYDCHSSETRWPWYGRIAPVSWLMAHDVEEGREHLNFSEWGQMDDREQEEQMEEIWEVVEEGEMPLWFYLPLHPEARIDDADRAILRKWVAGSLDAGSASVDVPCEDSRQDC